MIHLGWLLLAGLAFLASFGAAWWYTLLAAGLAFATWRYRERRSLVLSVAASLVSAFLWIALIPSTQGSEAVLVMLALISVWVAVTSARQITKPVISAGGNA